MANRGKGVGPRKPTGRPAQPKQEPQIHFEDTVVDDADVLAAVTEWDECNRQVAIQAGWKKKADAAKEKVKILLKVNDGDQAVRFRVAHFTITIKPPEDSEPKEVEFTREPKARMTLDNGQPKPPRAKKLL